ncbi:hypothetical protein VTN02DRAFT_3933 [Thermoascus thermophilus]
MRSGLQKPGVIPLLALLVFALLRLAPALPQAWDRYQSNSPRTPSYVANGHTQSCVVPDGPLVNTESASLASCDKSAKSMSHPVDEPYRPSDKCVRPSAESRLHDTNPGLPDAAHRAEDGPHSSTAIFPRIGALTSLVSQSYQLSYRELFYRLADRSPSPPAGCRPLSTSADLSDPKSIISSTGSPDEVQPINSKTIRPSNNLDNTPGSSRLSIRLREKWQQVCKRGVDPCGPEGSLTASRVNPLRALLSQIGMSPRGGQPLPKSRLSSSKPVDSGRPQLQQPKRAPAIPPRSQPPITHLFDIFALAPTPSTAAEQENVAGVPSNPKQMRGSCMAVVVGLVVGIMWF